MKSIPLTDLHNKTRDVLRIADKTPVIITSYGRDAYLLTNIEVRDNHLWSLEDCIEKLLGKDND